MEQSYDLLSMRLRNSKWFVYGTIAALALGLAMLIAGGVMLGVGIHKHNQRVEAASCPVPPPVTSSSTAPSTTTTMTTTPKPSLVKSVLILLDASSDISAANFQIMKDYVALNIAPSLPINAPVSFRTFSDFASDVANVALLSYSAEAVSIHNMYDASDVVTLQNQIVNIPQSQALPSVSKAVLTANQLFATQSTPNVMMVMGSGNQQDLDKAATGVASLGSVAWVALGAASQLDFTKINSTATVYTSRTYELSANQTKNLVGQLNPSNIS
uniref:VWFA domain-containing protein n=2 Tax=Panagrolaimus sp. JU765 TaxID=591449 RepID=A0AC34RFX9_9BILA